MTKPCGQWLTLQTGRKECRSTLRFPRVFLPECLVCCWIWLFRLFSFNIMTPFWYCVGFIPILLFQFFYSNPFISILLFHIPILLVPYSNSFIPSLLFQVISRVFYFKVLFHTKLQFLVGFILGIFKFFSFLSHYKCLFLFSIYSPSEFTCTLVRV